MHVIILVAGLGFCRGPAAALATVDLQESDLVDTRMGSPFFTASLSLFSFCHSFKDKSIYVENIIPLSLESNIKNKIFAYKFNQGQDRYVTPNEIIGERSQRLYK